MIVVAWQGLSARSQYLSLHPETLSAPRNPRDSYALPAVWRSQVLDVEERAEAVCSMPLRLETRPSTAAADAAAVAGAARMVRPRDDQRADRAGDARLRGDRVSQPVVSSPNRRRRPRVGAVRIPRRFLDVPPSASKGGIRRRRLGLYLAEYSWRYNHRKMTPRDQIRELFRLIDTRRRSVRITTISPQHQPD
jgi:hypothetical protein